MKTVIVIIFLFACCNVSRKLVINNATNNIDTIKLQTIDIMNVLGIKIRKNVSKDEHLTFSVYQSGFIACSYRQEFITPYYKYKKTIDTVERWYIKPNIAVSSTLDSILNKKKESTRVMYLNSIGSIMHELTHYYQHTFVDDDNYVKISTVEDFQKYAEQPVELESSAVESYFLLYFADRKKLSEIMKLKVSQTERFKMLYNSAHALLYPGDTRLLLK